MTDEKKQNTSMTALVSCFSRAYHSQHSRVKILDDYFAEKLILPEEYNSIAQNMSGGINFFNPGFKGTGEEALKWVVNNRLSPSVLGRSAFAENALLNAIRTGAEQYLIFAAGYDTSAYRLTKELEDINVFELDRKEVISDKRNRLQTGGIDYSHVNYISCDFSLPNWTDKLKPCELKHENKCMGVAVSPKILSFCSLLGISYYLSENEFRKLLSGIQQNLAQGSSVIFDFQSSKNSVETSTNEKLAQGAGESMKAKYSIRKLEKLLEECGLLIYELLDSAQMEERFFQGHNEAEPDNLIHPPKGIGYCLAVVRRDS